MWIAVPCPGMRSDRLAAVGRALGDPSRAAILTALASGRPRSAGELAAVAGLARSTTSRHLAVLVDAGMIEVDPSGRHRFFRLKSPEIAELLNLIDVMHLPEPSTTRRRRSSTLVEARTCYDHLAGSLGVAIYEWMLATQKIDPPDEHGPRLTATGHTFLRQLGVDTAELGAQPRPLARACLDWEQRRHHLGGGTGAALLLTMLTRGWLERSTTSRAVTVTPAGEAALDRYFGPGFAQGRAR